MPALPLVHHVGTDVDLRLAKMAGLSTGILRDAIIAGERARVGCGTNMPPCFPGSAAWAHTVCALRDQLLPLGWAKNDEGNYPTVIAPDGSFAIGVNTGNEFTGNPFRVPKTKFPKGPATLQKVVNNGDVDLFGQPVLVTVSEPVQLTWLLLLARIGDAVRCELSRPSDMGEDGRVDTWMERIILPEFRGDDLDPRVRLPEPGPEIDVPVLRRAES